MRIRYVVSTMIFWWRETRLSLEQECQFLRSLGFGVELWPSIRGLDDCRYERRNWARLKAATDGMLVAMRTRNDRPSLEQWDEQLQCAKMLGAHLVADLPSLRISQNLDRDGYDFAAEVIHRATTSGVSLCLETGPLPVMKKAGEVFDSLRYCLDTGHANLDPDHDFKQYVDALAPRISHLHLTDNYGFIDDHERPGLAGGIARENWDYLLETLMRFDNDIIGSFEMCPCMPGVMIRQAGEFIFGTLNWPNPPHQTPTDVRQLYHPF